MPSEPGRTPPPHDAGRVARLLGRALLVVGGVAVAIRLTAPALRRVGDADGRYEAFASPTGADDSGRGAPAGGPTLTARRAGHELEDMSGRTMARLVAFLGVIAVLMVFGMVGMRSLMLRWHAGEQPPLTLEQTTPVVPPAPHVQADPPADIARLDQAATERLSTYGWVGPDHARARIPIDRAMALIVGRPLDQAP